MHPNPQLRHHGLTQYLQQDRERFYRIAYSYAREREAALDIVQNAILAALRNLHTLREERYMKTWFYRILVNESLSEVRRRKRRGVNVDVADLALPAPPAAPPESPGLYELLQTLSPNQQTVVLLRYFEELKIEEIAAVTHWNVNTVKTRLYQAIKQLRKELAHETAS